MKNFQKKDFGSLNNLDQYVFAPEGADIRLPGKLFLADQLGLSSMEISLNKNAPGTGMSFFHRHTNHEEVYIFLSGQGEMLIDDEHIPVEEGTSISIQPDAKRSWWNTGDKDLIYIVMQAPVGGMKTPALVDGEILEGQVPWN